MSVVSTGLQVAAPAQPEPVLTPPTGLTEAEATERRARGLGNKVPHTGTRSYGQIIWQNAFTFINVILFAIGIALVIMQRPDDAVVTAGVVLINVIVGVYQEARAKQKLDQIALLTRPKATVIRDGQEKSADPSEIVLGDLLVARPGDQIVVDGQVRGDGQMEVDESLLTGESDHIEKKAGDPVYSGSFCVEGSAQYQAEKVGGDSVAAKITAGAKAFRIAKTPLQSDVDFVVRTLVVLVTILGLMIIASLVLRQLPAVESVRAAAVLVGLVPQGLFFLITIAYAVGAVRMSGSGALVQQANAVESMSNVNVLCMDKTGTLTTNAIKMNTLHALNMSEEQLKSVLGDYALNTDAPNKTSQAIGEAFKGQKHHVAEEAPFSSDRKWSAISFDDPDLKGTYVLGAPEMVIPGLQGQALPAEFTQQRDEWAAQGLRVLLFAYKPDVVPLRDQEGNVTLPLDLLPVGILSFSDELRPEAKDTIERFAKAGIKLKVISGDNPDTVASLARQAGFQGDLKVISGLDLATMSDTDLANAAEETTVFGRITPEQKQKLVTALKSKGHYVAMTGDGVNDVLALKQANLGIAMNTGAQVTRSAADIVLLNDSFGVLPKAFLEGQRIVDGVRDVVRLLLTRTLYLILLIVGLQIMGFSDEFPITPKHNSLLALLTVGIPTIALVAWAKPGQGSVRLIRAVTHFVVPAAISVSAVGLAIYTGFYLVSNGDAGLARTALTATLCLCGIALIIFVEPPTTWLAGGDVYSGDWRPTILAGVMLVLFALAMFVPALRSFFEMTKLGLLDLLIIVASVAVWFGVLLYVWRAKILERVLRSAESSVA